ncbi:hypothetical protein AQ742_07985 [Burkholderia pseudomallei]|nr:hypothetical protein AQ742_07985 [Burkholderia pseudomallei]
MTTIRAMVVGIGRYEQAGWDVDGPLAVASDVAGWLLGLKGVTLQLDLFVDADAALSADLIAVEDGKRLTVHRETSATELNRFAREHLPLGVQPGTELFFFWSGHGMICDTSDHRVFACGDYREGRQDAFFNASNFVRFLRTSAFSAFSNQIVLADVCGVYKHQAQVTLEHLSQFKRPQVVRYASLVGDTAKTAAAGGTFVKTVLAVLGATPGYPHDLAKLEEDFHAAGLRIDAQTVADAAGLGVDGSRAALFESAWNLLRGLDAHAFFRRHYERTVADLGVPARAHDLTSALQDLCEMRDDKGAVPHGLMQFMMRLATVPALSAPIKNWLDIEAKDQPHSRQEIADKLAREGLQRLLLVEVRQEGGEIVGLRPYLCCTDGSFDQSHRFDERPVRGWMAFEAAMHAILTEVAPHFSLDEMQIQFVIDLPLLGRPFHRVPTPDGSLLGQHARVVLRDRGRVFSSNPKTLKKWAEYASSLRGRKPAEVQWIRIDDGPNIPPEQGLCFAGFSLPHPVEGVPPARGKEVLRRVLNLGVPFLYIRHQPPSAPGEWGDVAHALQTLSGGLGNLEDFVEKFHDARLHGAEDALEASLLWDDPSFNPFTNAHGR